MSLDLTRKTYRDELAWLASHRSAQFKTGGITLSHIHRAQDPRTGRRIYRSGEFVGLLDPAAAGLFGRYVREFASYARLVTDAGVANGSIVWTAREPGTGGNAITLELVDPGVEGPIDVAVAANAITVTLGNDATPAIDTTADELISAIEANDDARALVYGERARGHDGSGLVTAIGATNLAGGLDATGTQADLVTDDIDGVANTDITYTAKQLGAAGNNIQVEYVADIARPNQPIDIQISGDGTAANPYVFTIYYQMDTGTAASLTTGDIDAVADTSIVYTANAPGEAGDNIQVEYVVDGTDTPLSIEVVGAGTAANPYHIIVNLETDGGGDAQSTAAEIIAAVNSHFLSGALITATDEDGDTGVPLIDYGPESLAAGVDPVPVSTAENIVDAVNSHYFTSQIIEAEATDGDDGIPLIDYGPEALAGGADANVSMDEGEFGILINNVDVTDGNGIGAILWGGKVLDARLPAASDEFVRAALPKVAFTTENAP